MPVPFRNPTDSPSAVTGPSSPTGITTGEPSGSYVQSAKAPRGRSPAAVGFGCRAELSYAAARAGTAISGSVPATPGCASKHEQLWSTSADPTALTAAEAAPVATCWGFLAQGGRFPFELVDSGADYAWLERVRHPGITAYPTLWLISLVETGSRGLLGAAVGPKRHGENHYARQPPYLLGDDFLVVADRVLDDGKFHGEVSARCSRAPVIAASTNSTQCAFNCSRGTSVVQCGRTAKPWTAVCMYPHAVRERLGVSPSPHDEHSRVRGQPVNQA